jgi:hypothetical protein
MTYTDARKQAVREADAMKAEGLFGRDPFDVYYRDWVDNRVCQLLAKRKEV